MATEAKPRVMIAVPGFAGVQPECQENFFALAFTCGRILPDYDFMIKIITKREQFRARNQLVHMALANNCQWLLMLDDDMLVPADLVKQLLAHDKDVCGALYWQRGGAHHPVIMQSEERDDGQVDLRFLSPYDPVIRQKGLHEVDIIGGGCMLFRVDVFRKLTPPYFWWEAQEGTDIAICRRLHEAGVHVWCDTSIELGHLSDKQVITSRTIPKHNAEMGRLREALVKDLELYLGMGQQELEGKIVQAGATHHRRLAWQAAPRDTWEAVRAYYQDDGWALFNLAYWAINRLSPQTLFAVTEMERFVARGGTVVDIGPGLGLTSIELAKQGYRVIAVDIAGASSLAFLKWRAQRLELGEQIDVIELEAPYPEKPLTRHVDAALIISVLDHLWAPYDTLEWLLPALVPGAPLVCDWEFLPTEHEPQHLLRYDVHQFEKWMGARNMHLTPEYSWLWKKHA